MSNVTVRVPEELKDRMKRCKGVNWSDVARKAFEDAARKEEYSARHRQSKAFD